MIRVCTQIHFFTCSHKSSCLRVVSHERHGGCQTGFAIHEGQLPSINRHFDILPSMKFLQACLICVSVALQAVVSQVQASYNDPKRVRISGFYITLAPTQLNMTIIEAEMVRDAAESLFEEYLLSVDWNSSTIYDYAGLAGIETLFVDDTRTPHVTVIEVRGGLVVFGGDTTVVPAENEIEAMLRASLYPDSPNDPSLTDLLNDLGNFGVIESSSYEAIRSPTPTQRPSSYPVLTDHPSSTPSLSTPSPSPSLVPTSLAPTITTSRAPVTLIPSLFDVATEPPSPSPSQVTTSPSFAPFPAVPIELQPSPTERPSPSPSRMTTSQSYAPAKAAPIEDQPLQPSHAPSFLSSSQPTLLDPAIDPLSSSPTLSDSSSAQESQNPSTSASFDDDVSRLTGGNQASTNSPEGKDSGIIGGVVGGFVVVSLFSMLLLLSRHRKRHQIWKAGLKRSFPEDDLEDAGLHMKDHLREHSVADGKSETGSSMLGRLRIAASVQPQRPSLNESPETTPQSSSGSDSGSPFETTCVEVALISPRSAKEEFAGTSRSDQSASENNILAPGQSMPTAWSNTSSMRPFDCASALGDGSTALIFDRWSDCSTNREIDTNPEESDTDGNFTVGDGDAWDFQDNDDDESEADPFSTAAYTNGADTVTLLGAIVERSSTRSPGDF